MEIQRGRFTADIDGDFVIFLICMRFNTAAARIGASATDEPAAEPF